jgi:tight adherence protein C
VTPLEWTIYVTGGAAAASAVFFLLALLRQARALAVAGAGEEVVVTETSSDLVRALLPSARRLGAGLRALLAHGRSEALYLRFHRGLEGALSRAGRPQGLNADEYVGLGILLALACGGLGVGVYLLLGPEAMFSVYAYFVLGLVLGAALWKGWLSRAGEARQRSIRRDLPFALDLLTLAMEAGLDFTTALSRIVQKLGATPLGREFSLMLREIQLGKTRSDALRDMAGRVDVPEVRSVVVSLVQAEELGAPLGGILRIQAAAQREKRSQRAEEAAGKTPVKMIFPLIVLLFPATILILFGPLFMELAGVF